MDEQNIAQKTRQPEKVNSTEVTQDNKASLRVNQQHDV
jgi:hypothetical protein